MPLRGLSSVVLGGGGFLGTNLCRRLLVSGNRVRAFGRRRLSAEAMQGVEWHEGDFSDAEALTAAIESADIVFHLIHANTPYFANLDMIGDLQQNVVPSLAMLNISQRLGVKRIVFVSSGGTIYGRPQQIPTAETAPTDPITAYGVSKLAIEKYLSLYEYLHGLEFRVLRVANPFGPFQTPAKRQGIIAELVSRAVNRERVEIWGDGSDVRDFIFVDDVIDALLSAAVDTSPLRVFNIGSGEGRSIRQVIAAVEALSDLKLDLTWKERRAVDVPISVLCVQRAKEVLGWAPKTSFEAGIQRTIAWWQNGALAAHSGAGQTKG